MCSKRICSTVSGAHKIAGDVNNMVIVKNSNALNALVSSEQIRFKQTSETVCTDSRVPRMKSGREFKTVGPTTDKTRRP